MRRLSGSGELASLSAERVFREFRKALSAPAPGRFFEVLAAARAIAPWFVEFVGVSPAFPEAADEGLYRFGGLGFELAAPALTALGERLRAPGRWCRLAQSVGRHGRLLLQWPDAAPEALHSALSSLGAYRDPAWADDLAPVLQARGGAGLAPLAAAVARIRGEVTSAPLRAEGLSGPALGRAIAARREQRLADWLAQRDA
jgi:tRNA nucleotidyltransferase (CCA-adding enzyme)